MFKRSNCESERESRAQTVWSAGEHEECEARRHLSAIESAWRWPPAPRAQCIQSDPTRRSFSNSRWRLPTTGFSEG